MSGLSRPAQWLSDAINTFMDRHTESTDVTPYTATTLSAVWYAVDKIAGDIGQLPLCPYRKNGRQRDQAIDHPAYRLLRQEANAYQTAHQFKELLTSHALLWGNGRAYVRRDNRGEPVELIPLLPDRTETMLVGGEKIHITKPNRDERLTTFEDLFSGEGDPEDRIVVRDADCLHIMGHSELGVAGVGIITKARRSISVGLEADHRAQTQMKKGFTGRVMLEAPQGAFRKAEDAKEFLGDFRKAHASSEDGETIGLLRDGTKANVMNISNGDMQFLESRAFQVQEIMRWFGLESMPGDADSVSYNSLAQKSLSYHQGTLSRWCDRWEQGCNKSLRSDTEKRQESHYFKFKTGAMLRGTTKERYEVYQIGRQIGVLSANDVREMEDLNPIEGGDEYSNPAITPGSFTQTGDDASGYVEASATDERASLLMLQNLIGVECKKAVAAAKNRNFLSWMDKFYSKWESKLADTVESIGGDREIATEYCEESRSRLLSCADVAKSNEELESMIINCVSSWPSRASQILNEMESCSV